MVAHIRWHVEHISVGPLQCSDCAGFAWKVAPGGGKSQSSACSWSRLTNANTNAQRYNKKKMLKHYQLDDW